MRITDLVELGFPRGVGTVGLAELLREKYPEQQWDKIYLLRGKFALQKRLERAVGALFPVCSLPFLLISSPHYFPKGGGGDSERAEGDRPN